MSLKFREEMCKQCNIQASKSALFAVNASFLLNGSAGTLLLSQKIYLPAILCGAGALLSIICMGLTYLTMLGVSESWKPVYLEDKEYKIFWGIKVNKNNCESFRRWCFYFWFSSVILFGTGLLFSAIHISQNTYTQTDKNISIATPTKQ